MQRPFVKWMGGKSRVMDALKQKLPDGDIFIEPFVGGASVFLNTDYPEYILADSNPDLIQLLEVAADNPEHLIHLASGMFKQGTRGDYLVYRNNFNDPQYGKHPKEVRAAYFLYLNRHGYNGLCRYNAAGGYNVPYGKHPTPPYLPASEIRAFAEKVKKSKVTFLTAEFQQTLEHAQRQGSKQVVVYADPPYVPNSKTASFAQYHSREFRQPDHRRLAQCLKDVHAVGGKVVLSNSDTLLTREIYYGFDFSTIEVGRYMGADPKKRGKAAEVIATLF